MSLGIFSAVASACSEGNFFGLPRWYKYLDVSPDPTGGCSVDFTMPDDIWLVVAAVFEILARLGVLIAIVFVIYGGFRYITSGGNPDATGSARRTIIYSLVGFAVTVIASVTVSFIANLLSGGAADGGALPVVSGDSGTIQKVLQVVYALAGAISGLMVVIGGMKFVTSTGNPESVAKARNTIIYALVGLAVVLLAFAITNFIYGRIG